VNEEKIGHSVRDDAVEFLRHAAVEAAQSGLDMPDGDLQLCGHEGRRHGRVHIAWNEHDVGLVIQKERLEPLDDARGLLGMGAGANAEGMIGGTDAQFLDEDL
jgi:hypothetical protein